MANSYLKISRRKVFSFNSEFFLQNSFNRNLTIQVGIGNGEIYSDGRPIIKVMNFKEIFLDDDEFGLVSRFFGFINKKKTIFKVNFADIVFSVNIVQNLNFKGEKLCTLNRGDEEIGQIKYMQNIGFMGGFVETSEFAETDFNVVAALTFYLWMEKNFYLDNQTTGP